jgi:putative glutamine amidotransferase
MSHFDARPVIGVVTRRDRSETWKGFALYGQGIDYVRAIAAAGGAPVLIPLELGEPAWRSIYARLGGLLFPGGVDVHPAYYGESPHPQLGRVDDALDEAEMTLARWALDDRMPTLGVCRGIQLINVAGGGSLYQDLPAQVPGVWRHSCGAPEYPPDYRAHPIAIEAGTRLSVVFNAREIQTNSRHHQAVKDVAPGFVVSARSPDGVIEGIEKVDAPFVVGVQWHPENMVDGDPLMQGLFQAFVRACRR